MDQIERGFFRDELRSARGLALADAEGFHTVLRVVELLGQRLHGRIAGLGKYKPALLNLARDTPLGVELPSRWPGYHTAFDALFDEMRQARNDAVHQGAYARTLTDHAVELSILLEVALMTNASTVSQFMVRNVVSTKPWQPISYVRQQMLTHAFSYLPIWHSGAWKLLPEFSIARLLRSAPADRGRHLAAPVSDAVSEGKLELLEVAQVHPETPIGDIIHLIAAQPVLVVERDRPHELVGLLTASDVL
jgi:predicted transcriptional regulator